MKTMKARAAITIDSELSGLIPPLLPEELALLEANIVNRGCRDPLVVWGDILIDGHNRFEICNRLGLPFQTVAMEFEDRDAVMDWMDANQLGRRNLSPDAFKLLLGRRYNRVKQGHGGQLPGKGIGQIDPPLSTADRLATQYGVSPKTVKRAGAFAAEVERTPELQRSISLNIPVLQIKREMRKVRMAEKERLASEKNALDEQSVCITAKQGVVTCDALITDPPYGILDEPWEPKKLEDFTREWLSRWNECGADFFVSFFSQRHLFDGRVWFDDELTNYEFQQVLVWVYRNNLKPQSRKGFKQTWEPIFLYRRKESERLVSIGGCEWGDELNDLDTHIAAMPNANFNDTETKKHPAQKPLTAMRWLVNALSDPYGMVADPFCGSGTTGVACSQLNRKFHGIELSKEYRELATMRIRAYGEQKE